MDDRFSGPLDMDSERAVSVLMYAIGTPLADVAAGSATVDVDLSPFVSTARQTQDEFSATLNWHMELYGAAQPKARRPLAVLVNGMAVFIGLIETVNDYRLSSGNRTMSLTARTRDATPAWRELPRVTKEYPQGTQLDVIARDVSESLLTPGEVLLPALGINTPHTSMQLAGTSAWAMLETLLLPAGFTPYIDGLGRLRAWSRDVQRAPDIVLTEERLKEVNGGKSKTTATRLQVKWLDPALTYVEQQDRILGGANITAGFFQLEQKQDIWFSDDHTQRARSTRMVVRQSANSGLFNVCSEDYEPVGMEGGEAELHGIITLETAVWVPGLLAAMLATKAAGALPDIAPPFGGPTSPVGKIVQAALEFSVMVTLASMGTGVYEVWGIPYDYVHGRNTTEAYDPDAELGTDKLQTIETDFITNEAHAQAVAGREFFFQALAANSYGITIVDDLRVQVGDIIQLPDESKVFVTGFQRDLGRGAPAELSIEAFYIPATLGAQQAPPEVVPPTAAFTTSGPHIGTAPLSVPFVDASEGGPTSWHWVFGDGTESFERNPVHVFEEEGTFDVSLTVTNSAGSDSVIVNDFVRVDEVGAPLIADFDATPLVGWLEGQEHMLRVGFTNKSQGQIKEVLWDFGDGLTYENDPIYGNDVFSPWHRFFRRGDFDVTLTITDFDDNQASITKPVYVIVGDYEPLRYDLEPTMEKHGAPVAWDGARFLAFQLYGLGVYESTAGTHYTQIPSAATLYRADRMHVTPSGRLIAWALNLRYLQLSDDDAVTWREPSGIPRRDEQAHWSPPSRMINLTDGRVAMLKLHGEIRTSSDNGETWTRHCNVNDPSDAGYPGTDRGTDASGSHMHRGIAQGAGKILTVEYVSVGGGLSSKVYTASSVDGPFASQSFPDVLLTGCKFIDGYFYAWGLKEVDVGGVGSPYLLSCGYIMRSSNGTSWTDVSPTPVVAPTFSMSSNFTYDLFRLGSGRFVALGDNVNYVSDDGAAWTEVRTNLYRNQNLYDASIEQHFPVLGFDDFPGPIAIPDESDPLIRQYLLTTGSAASNGTVVAGVSRMELTDKRRNVIFSNNKPVITEDGEAWTPLLTDLYDPGP